MTERETKPIRLLAATVIWHAIRDMNDRNAGFRAGARHWLTTRSPMLQFWLSILDLDMDVFIAKVKKNPDLFSTKFAKEMLNNS